MDDALWTNCHAATMGPGAPRGAPYGAIADAAIAVQGGKISWVGPRSAWSGRAAEEIDAHGAWITPGLIDCHTHVVHAGNRAAEFEQRLNGATYEEIARAGGGIASTVRATRAADEDSLIASARARLAQWTREGATVVEIKSGYGLEVDSELRMLRAARRLGAKLPLTVRTTFLGAHALPEEYRSRPDAYIDLVCEDMLPRVASEGLADAVDAFCEGIGFSSAQTRRVFDVARALGLPVKLHADQLSDLGGAALAAEYQALSADHLEYTSEAGARAMAAAGTVAVLLPGAFYFLREKQSPPIDALRRAGVPMALATDCNPGSSPLTSVLLVLNLACTLFRLTPEEALAGLTRNAARALGIEASHGTLVPGADADFALWSVDSPAELCYAIGANPCLGVVRRGQRLQSAP